MCQFGKCINTIGSFRCYCPKGFRQDGIHCTGEYRKQSMAIVFCFVVVGESQQFVLNVVGPKVENVQLQTAILLPQHLSPSYPIQMSTSACCVIITGRVRMSARIHMAHSNAAVGIYREPFWPPMDSGANSRMTAKRITADVRTRV